MGTIGAAAERNFVCLYLEALLEEENVVRGGAVEGITKKLSHLTGLNSIQNVCIGVDSRRICGRGSSVERWTIRLQISNKGVGGSR